MYAPGEGVGVGVVVVVGVGVVGLVAGQKLQVSGRRFTHLHLLRHILLVLHLLAQKFSLPARSSHDDLSSAGPYGNDRAMVPSVSGEKTLLGGREKLLS